MARAYGDIAGTPSVIAAQEANGHLVWPNAADRLAFDELTPQEVEFIEARDSFYIATVSETGWPYVQHRGGPRGFLVVLDKKMLAFADFRGNRQYISLGNTGVNDRAALILMDYPHRRRLKIYARAEEKSLAADPALTERLVRRGYRAKPERAFVLRVASFDWNCPQHITARFTQAEIDEAIAPMRARLGQLEVENQSLREKMEQARGASR